MLKRAVDMDREIRQSAWAECRHVKSVKQLEREAAEARREWRTGSNWFRIRPGTTWGENGKAARRATTSHRAIRTSSAGAALPKYGFALRDSRGRLFVFQRIRYASAATTKQGHAKGLVRYGADGAWQFEDGSLAFASNVGSTPEEAGAAFDQLELVNRSASTNAKIAFHGFQQSVFDLSPEQQFEAAKQWGEAVFGSQGLPYALALHPPSEDGDQRNWHIHFVFSFRPMVRTDDGELMVGRFLRTDLDCPEQFTRLRYLWAEELNHACQKAGIPKRFTHLSYQAAGVDFIPQEHLGPGLTAKVRRGETVRKDLANRQAVLRNTLHHAHRTMKTALNTSVAACLDVAHDTLAAFRAALALRTVTPSFEDHRPISLTGDLPQAVPSPLANGNLVERVQGLGRLLKAAAAGLPATLPTVGERAVRSTSALSTGSGVPKDLQRPSLKQDRGSAAERLGATAPPKALPPPEQRGKRGPSPSRLGNEVPGALPPVLPRRTAAGSALVGSQLPQPLPEQVSIVGDGDAARSDRQSTAVVPDHLHSPAPRPMPARAITRSLPVNIAPPGRVMSEGTSPANVSAQSAAGKFSALNSQDGGALPAATADNSRMSQPRLAALERVAQALEEKPSGLRLDENGIVRPRAIVLASFGGTPADVASAEGQGLFRPIFAEEQLRLHAVEREVTALGPAAARWFEIEFLARPVFGGEHVAPASTDQRHKLSAQALATTEAYRRSELLLEVFHRVRLRQAGETKKTRRREMRDKGVDPRALVQELAQARLARSAVRRALAQRELENGISL